MTLWWMPNLCDWRSMNEVKWVKVISDPCEGTVSFNGFLISRWGDLWWVHPYGVRQCKLQGNWGWALALNDSKVHLIKNHGDSVSQVNMHKSLVAKCFLTNYTCLDNSYVVSKLSRYTHNPNVEHWDAISRLLRYLKGIFYFGLSFCGYPAIL